ncbi:MAG: methylenetetrahydrofolate reductase [Prevotella sp.]|nr:methylenetetrahydrofolate reductase [Prevotella sp.]MBQ8060085.1 methylenetetrahydrofolate reductase [Prevotella sp.]MBQ8114797.1 methylenetetrahydrofolate reductase [Prevotella sp.]
MKVIDIIKEAEEKGGKRFSIELLPPLKGDGLDKIFHAITTLLPYEPAFINVTSSREQMKYVERPDGLIEKHIVRRRPGTVGVSAAIKQKYGIEVVPHMICGGQSKYDIEDALIDLDFLGIQNVLALRGDAMPGTSRFVAEKDGHAHAEQLVEQIINMNNGRFIDGEPDTRHNTDFCVGVAGYPEKHVESPNYLTDLGYLKQKVDAGAEYIATQICYDTDKIIAFRDKCSEIGINVPILPGLKPFASKTQLTVLPQTFAVDLPQELVDRVVQCKNNDDVKKVGVEWAIKQGEKLQKAGFPVLHFYTMTRTEQVQQIIKELI